MDFEKLKKAMTDLDENTVQSILQDVMRDGGSQAPQALEALQLGMITVGDRFESGEYFVGDLIFSGELMTDAVKIIGPALAGSSSGHHGRMIFCTVKGDIHDIGKNIVKSMLEADGFEVLDLGVDVAPETIVGKAKEENIRIIALSGVLSVAINAMKDTVEAFKAAGLRESAKIIVGGAPITKAACDSIGADAWATNPLTSVSICREWVEG